MTTTPPTAEATLSGSPVSPLRASFANLNTNDGERESSTAAIRAAAGHTRHESLEKYTRRDSSASDANDSQRERSSVSSQGGVNGNNKKNS